MFFECYLGRSAEGEITLRNARYLWRRETVEAGNLAAGYARLLLVTLTDILMALLFSGRRVRLSQKISHIWLRVAELARIESVLEGVVRYGERGALVELYAVTA